MVSVMAPGALAKYDTRSKVKPVMWNASALRCT